MTGFRRSSARKALAAAGAALAVMATASLRVNSEELISDSPAVAATAAKPPPAPALAAVPRNMSALHRLTADSHQLRFEGETAVHVYPVFFTGGEANSRMRVHLSFTNAVSVMPEASRLVVTVNDVRLGEVAITSNAQNDPTALDLDIPEGVVEPGYNALRIAVTQHHRVDCSMGATYELWTQLDPANSGFALSDSPAESITDLSDLPALAPDATGATPLRLVVPKGVTSAALDRMLRAVEGVAIQGRFTHPIVDIVEAPVEEPGLDIMVGTVEDLHAQGFADYLAEDAPLAMRPGRKQGHSTLVVAGHTSADVDNAVALLGATVATDSLPGTAEGLRALTMSGGILVEGQKTFSLRALGIQSQEFSGRLFRAGFDILMPPDFYAGDYGKMTLRVDAGYVAGLNAGSQILVRVNDRDAASLPLRNPKGDVFRDHPINVSLGDLRPGFNHVQIEAQVSAPADKVCDVQATLENKKRFVLLEDSTLEMPNIARIAHLPNLASTAAGGFPYLTDKDTTLYVPRPDADTISAVATFLARAAVAAGQPLSTRIAVGKAPIDDKSAIIIGSIHDLPPAILDGVGVDSNGIRAAWAHAEPKVAAARSDSTARTGDERPNLVAVKQGISKGENELFQKWSANVSSDQWRFDPIGFGADLLNRAVGLSSSSIAPWARVELPVAPDAASRILIAQHGAPAGNGSTWTLVTAPTGELLSRTMRDLTAASAWNKIEGRVATLDPKTGAIQITDAKQGYFIRTAALSPGNVRLIAAGWLSSHLEYYVLGLIALSLGLGLTTTAVVRRSGVKV